jgi:hypothetical protein
MRGFSPHGNYRTLFLFDVWDRFQSDILPRHHFKYCLGYDCRPRAVRAGYFHLWLSRTRIYRKREDIVATLERELPRLIPPGFFRTTCNRAFDIKFEFDYPKNLSDLPDLLLPRYVSLISAIHPILMPLIDQFTTPLAPGERRAVVAARGRSEFTPPGVYDRAHLEEYSRSIKPSMRREVLEAHDYRCALCGCDLRSAPHHIDHIKPFARQGPTVRKNLQPLCAPCNLKKGARE